MPTPAAVQTRINLIRSESSRLADYLAGQPSAAWNHPTACDRWQAADVIAHLVWIGEFYAIFIDRAFRDDLSPPPESPKDPKYAATPPEDFYTLKAFEYRRELGGDLLPAFTRRFAELAAALERLTPADYDRPCFYHSGNRPLWTLADLAVQELAIHAWDIQSHAAPDARLSPESQPVLLARVIQRPQPPVSLPAYAPDPARLRFILSGPVSTSYDLLTAPDATAIEPAGPAQPAAAFHCAAETFILLLYRRLDFPQAITAGQISISGNAELAQQFAAAF